MPPSDLKRARRVAKRRYKSEGLRSAYVAGARAKLTGLPPDACPYPHDSHKTWRAVYRKAWLNGYASMTT